MSIYRVIDFQGKAGVLLSSDFMTSVTVKMLWMQWMALSWMEESSEYRWLVTEDPQMLVAAEGVVMEAEETVEGGGPTQDLVPVLAQETVTVVIAAAQDPQGDPAAVAEIVEVAAVAGIKSR